MSRLTKIEKKSILKLIDEGVSINKISNITKKAKSTIYYHYNIFKGKKFKIPLFNFTDEELGEFIRIFAGDGGFFFDPKTYKYSISIYTGFRDEQYNMALIDFFTKVFNKKPLCYSRHSNHVYILRYHSKLIYTLIKAHLLWEGVKTYSVRLKSINNHPKEFYIGFLRGLFDTDGNFYKPKNRVSYGTVSEELSLQVSNLMKSFGFRSSYYISKKEKFYTIAIYGKEALRFIKLINPRNFAKITR